MLKIAVTAPIATARINTTVADNQPPRRTFLDGRPEICRECHGSTLATLGAQRPIDGSLRSGGRLQYTGAPCRQQKH